MYKVLWISTMEMMAIGTPMKKVHRQPSGESTINPPSRGPPAVAAAMTPPK